MSPTYREIIREMKLSGHYSEAESLERSLKRGHGSEYDRVYSRSDARDGLSIMSYAGDIAERAYDDLRYRERREQERKEEEEQEQRWQEQERHRRAEQEFYEAQREAEEAQQEQQDENHNL